MNRSKMLGAFGAALCTLTTWSAQAVTVPVGVNPGDTYQLVFVTAGTIDALSTNIADYNSFVQGEAALNPALTGTDMGVTYTAIASTSSVNANANAAVTAAVYLVDGSALVATGFSDLWDGNINAAIDRNQYGVLSAAGVAWTGSEVDGTASVTGQVVGLGGGSTFFGGSNETDALWVHNGAFGNQTVQLPIYALSSVITAPVPVPVPAALWLFGPGLMGLVAVVRRKTRA